jgi:hypothetical protein
MIFIISLIVIIILYLIYGLYFSEKFAGNLSTEAIQNISSLYNQEQLKISNLTTTNNLTTNTLNTQGETNFDGDINIHPSGIIKGQGRLHISGEETLYLLNKNGVIIGKEWGGNGNLVVEGDTNIQGNLNSADKIITPSLFKMWPMSRNAGECAQVIDDDTISLASCNNIPEQLWYWNGQQIVSSKNNKCLASTNGEWASSGPTATVGLRPCNNGDRSQVWNWRDDHRVRNMLTGNPLRIPQDAQTDKNNNYGPNFKADMWDWSCGNDCEIWFG